MLKWTYCYGMGRWSMYAPLLAGWFPLSACFSFWYLYLSLALIVFSLFHHFSLFDLLKLRCLALLFLSAGWFLPSLLSPLDAMW